MKLREEIEKVFEDMKIFPVGLGYGKDSNVSHWRVIKFGALERLFRSWALGVLRELLGNSEARSSELECSQGGYEWGIEDAIKKIEEATG